MAQCGCHQTYTLSEIEPPKDGAVVYIQGDKLILRYGPWIERSKINYCPICGRKLDDSNE